jgi:tRNA dimethylallyltransferase
MPKISHKRVLVIVGPTASGKSGLAIELARQFDGEIISADSRQIYRGMDIGTGKVTPEEQALVRHWLLGIIDPTQSYNVTDFQRDAQHAIADIRSRGKLPIICGGTGFWVQALVANQQFPGVEPNWELREELSKLSREELFSRLELLDPERAQTIDRNNPVRLIRAIEIAKSRSMEHEVISNEAKNTQSIESHTPYSTPLTSRIIALNPPLDILKEKIKKRLDERFDTQDMIGEVSRLHAQGLSWERLESFGLEYRWIAYYLQEKVTEAEMREKLYFASIHYAKRQLTWLRRWERQGAEIHWIDTPEKAIAFLN